LYRTDTARNQIPNNKKRKPKTTCHYCSVSVGKTQTPKKKQTKTKTKPSVSVSLKRSRFLSHLSLRNTHIDRSAKLQFVCVVLTFHRGSICHQQQLYDGSTDAASTMSFAVFVFCPLGHKQTASWCGLSSGTTRRRELCTPRPILKHLIFIFILVTVTRPGVLDTPGSSPESHPRR